MPLEVSIHADGSRLDGSGHIVGYYGGYGSDSSFIYSDGALTAFNVPSAVNTDAYGINDSGQIVGTYDGGGFLYSGGTFTAFGVPDAHYTDAFGINDSGQIVGIYSPVPESGTLLLLVLVMSTLAAAAVGAQFRGWRTQAAFRHTRR
jgi:uncharacterized membrane protein